MKFEPKEMTDTTQIEEMLYGWCPSILDTLLLDRTTGQNIFWATDSYVGLGSSYQADKAILPNLLSRNGVRIVVPRSKMTKEEQAYRTRISAKVFIPAEVIEYMSENTDKELKNNGFTNWQDFVGASVIEITCGMAPFLVTRENPFSGEYIEVNNRIGLLDRKLALIDQNTSSEIEWNRQVRRAYKSTYGYEFQGNNLFLARENLLFTLSNGWFTSGTMGQP